jgi:hypothetical protein
MNADEPLPPDDDARDEFAARLAAHPLLRAPADLRDRVLARAATAESVGGLPRNPQRVETRTAPSNQGATDHPARTSVGWLDRLWLRFPLATSALATCLLVVWCGASADRWLNGAPATAAVSVSAEQIAAARTQRTELFQLAGMDEPLSEARPQNLKPAPAALPNRPRGDRRRDDDDRFGRVNWAPSVLSV